MASVGWEYEGKASIIWMMRALLYVMLSWSVCDVIYLPLTVSLFCPYLASLHHVMRMWHLFSDISRRNEAAVAIQCCSLLSIMTSKDVQYVVVNCAESMTQCGVSRSQVDLQFNKIMSLSNRLCCYLCVCSTRSLSKSHYWSRIAYF